MANYNDEKRELLKLKQGLIEESELIPQNVSENIPELHGASRVKNELYHLKWILPMIIGAAALIAFIIIQLASRPREDLRVLIISAAENSALSKFAENTDNVKTAFEKYCDDYNGNGKVYVSTIYIDLRENTENIQYRDFQYDKFDLEINSGTAMLILADAELCDMINAAYESPVSAFVDLSNELTEDKLYNGCGAKILGTEFAGYIGEENAVLLVRNGLGNGGKEKSAQYKDRAVEVLKRILSEG